MQLFKLQNVGPVSPWTFLSPRRPTISQIYRNNTSGHAPLRPSYKADFLGSRLVQVLADVTPDIRPVAG